MQHKRSRVILRVLDQFLVRIASILEAFGINAQSAKDAPERRLRIMQQFESTMRAAREEANRSLDLPDAVVHQYRNEISRLQRAGYQRALGYPNERNFQEGIVSRLEEKIRTSFTHNEYAVGTAQRFVVPVFTRIDWKLALKMLAGALGAQSVDRDLKSSDSDRIDGRIVTVSYDLGFEQAYEDGRTAKDRPVIESDVYALCGVHGGKDTHEYRVTEEIAYFAKEHRFPLTLKEAAALYTMHPDFLSDENARVILLGEICDGKYVTFHYDKDACKLVVGLASAEEADRSFRPVVLHPNQFHGEPPPPSYGKPSAGAIIRP